MDIGSKGSGARNESNSGAATSGRSRGRARKGTANGRKRLWPHESGLTTKGQITIPNDVRQELGLKPGDRVRFFAHDGQLIGLPVRPVSELRGVLKTKRHATIDDMHEAAIDAAVARYNRSRRS